MSKIDEQTIKTLSDLSRIEVASEEFSALQKDLDGILNYVSELQSVEINGSNEQTPDLLINVMREDVAPHKGGVYSEDILSQAPKTKDGYISVKKILG